MSYEDFEEDEDENFYERAKGNLDVVRTENKAQVYALLAICKVIKDLTRVLKEKDGF